TTRAVAEAERAKQTAVIAKGAEAEQTAINRRNEADLTAYAAVKNAEGELDAATKRATARRTEAEGDKAAEIFRAEGAQATATMPVNVANAEVDVDRRGVEVLSSRLETQAKHTAITRDLEISLAQIAADKEARIAFAHAMGQALAEANLNIYGDPTAVG